MTRMARVTEVTRVMGLAKVKKVEGITEVQLVATATMIQPWMAVEGRAELKKHRIRDKKPLSHFEA